MNKIIVNKAVKRSILGHLMLCGLLGLFGTIEAATPVQHSEDTPAGHSDQVNVIEASKAYSGSKYNQEAEHEAAAAPIFPSTKSPIPHKMGPTPQKRQCYLVTWFEAARSGNRRWLTALYNNYNINVNGKNKNGYTALMESAKNGSLDCIKYLVEQKADVNTKDSKGNTALLWSAYNGYLDCVTLLVQQGANIHDKNRWGNTALLLSAQEGHVDCLKFLLQQGANIHDTNKTGNTALLLSAYSGHLDCVKFIAQQGTYTVSYTHLTLPTTSRV